MIIIVQTKRAREHVTLLPGAIDGKIQIGGRMLSLVYGASADGVSQYKRLLRARDWLYTRLD